MEIRDNGESNGKEHGVSNGNRGCIGAYTDNEHTLFI